MGHPGQNTLNLESLHVPMMDDEEASYLFIKVARTRRLCRTIDAQAEK